MDPTRSDYIQVVLSLRNTKKVARLSRSLDTSFSSLISLKKLLYKHFPELEDLRLGNYDRCKGSKESSLTGQRMELRWKDGNGNLVILENDEDLRAIEQATDVEHTTHIELSIGVLDPGTGISTKIVQSVTDPTSREKAISFTSGHSKRNQCIHFQAGHCQNRDACPFLHSSPDEHSLRREATVENPECSAPGATSLSPGIQSLHQSRFNPASRTSTPDNQLTGIRSSLPHSPFDNSLVAKFQVPTPQTIMHEHRLDKLQKLVSRPRQQPTQVACYSYASDGNVHWDDRCLRRFREGILSESGADLNQGFESYVERRVDEADLASSSGTLLACLRAKQIPLDDIHFVTYRHNLAKILGTVYFRRLPWEMGVHRRFGIIYLKVRKLPENPLTDLDQRRCYWGRSFEQLATEEQNVGAAARLEASRGGSSGNKVIDVNVEFNAVMRSNIGSHRIIMGAVMNCCNAGTGGNCSYVELKTTRELEHHTKSIEQFERVKLLSSWIQSFLGGVPRIVYGFRDDRGILVRTESMSTMDIIERVKRKRFWEGGVCLAFGDKVLSWLYDTAKENEDYVLRFVPEQSRLELLRADTCPESITKHVDELSATLSQF